MRAQFVYDAEGRGTEAVGGGRGNLTTQLQVVLDPSSQRIQGGRRRLLSFLDDQHQQHPDSPWPLKGNLGVRSEIAEYRL